MPAKTQSKVRTKKILATLSEHYELGCKALEYCILATKPKTISKFASKNGIDVRTARMRLAFAEQYSQAAFDKFCKLRRGVDPQERSSRKKANALPLLSAHVTYLLTIEAAVETWNKDNLENQRIARLERREFAKRAAKENLTPKQLHDAIRLSFGRNSIESHGRKHAIASDLQIAIGTFVDEGENWFSRGQLLITKIQNEPKPEILVVEPLLIALSAGQKRSKSLHNLLMKVQTTGRTKQKS